MTEPAAPVTAADLSVIYQRGGDPAVSDLSFTLAAGEGLLVTGAEGAGKTSVIRAVLGLCVAGGEVRVFGQLPGSREQTGRIGYGPQGKRFLEGHPAHRLVGLVARLRTGGSGAAAADTALERAGLRTGRWWARDLDVEECRRVALACALAGDPDLLVLDDPWEFEETEVAVRATIARGGAVLAASHDPGGLPALLGRSITLVDGRPA